MHAHIEQLLNSLPPEPGPADGWQRVQARLHERERAGRRRMMASLLAMAASLCIFTVLLTLWGQDQAAQAPAASAPLSQTNTAVAAVSLDTLQEQSQALEQLLAELPSRPAVERAATSLPIEALEAQVQWLDHRLSVSQTDDDSKAQAEQLWRQRVEAMNSLVRLRYAEAQRVNL
jgi:Skp family chaperone for outer membrane proteins